MLRRWRRLLRRLLSCGGLERAVWLGKGMKKSTRMLPMFCNSLARQRLLNVRAK
jgi:hypothetical protein